MSAIPVSINRLDNALLKFPCAKAGSSFKDFIKSTGVFILFSSNSSNA